MILHLLAEHLGEEISYNGLCRMLQETGLKVGVSTVVEYISILEKTRFIRSIDVFRSRLPALRNGVIGLWITGCCRCLFTQHNCVKTITEHNGKCCSAGVSKHTIYYASQRNASVDFYIPERNIAIVLCPNDELIPEAVQNLQRFDRKHPTTYKYIYTVGKISDSLRHFQYISA